MVSFLVCLWEFRVLSFFIGFPDSLVFHGTCVGVVNRGGGSPGVSGSLASTKHVMTRRAPPVEVSSISKSNTATETNRRPHRPRGRRDVLTRVAFCSRSCYYFLMIFPETTGIDLSDDLGPISVYVLLKKLLGHQTLT